MNFVEGLLDGLTGVGAITRDEASVWRELLIAPFSVTHARYSPTGGASIHPPSSVPRVPPHFIELIPAVQPAKELPDVCSLQILGVERYDAKVAIAWRMVPILRPTNADEGQSIADLATGPDMRSLEISDDKGTTYQFVGSSSGGRFDRVGRHEFIPAPPDGATILEVRWREMVFEISLGSSFA
ncbi:MAG: hypothetical protein ACYC19_03745 [Acidimicrobiales bacterium]